MRRDSKHNPFEAKRLAREKYAQRQIEKWIKWTIDVRGKMIYKELVEIHNKYNIKVYGS
jgi:hypothetical protein|tara:strand:- start:347 stop:523 length:177 start_codon:yes stop_codon:yes gene_type:complete